MSNVWSEGFGKNNNFDKFECNFAYHQKMSGYAPGTIYSKTFLICIHNASCVYRIYASPFETIQRPKITNEIEKNSKLRMTSSAKMTHLIFHIKKSILFHKIKFKLLLSGSRYFRKLLKSDRAYLYGGRDTRVSKEWRALAKPFRSATKIYNQNFNSNVFSERHVYFRSAPRYISVFNGIFLYITV